VCCYAGDGGSRIHVSAREYYTYLIQIRDGVFVIFFYGGRLFQQWLVDVYVKIESMRLDWYSNPEHQKMHGPCGVLNKNCGCMVDGVCRFKYPRQFCEGLNKRKTHILYIEEGRMDKRFLLGKNGWIIDGLFHITLPY